MSKIICEICGTAYPDTSKECPICGFPHSQAAEELDLDLDLDSLQNPEDTQTAPAVPKKVKGGRFTTKNVKKRHVEAYESPAESDPEPEDPVDPDEQGSQKGLKIAVAILAAVVILVGVYIGYRFISGSNAYNKAEESSLATDPSASESGTTQTQPTLNAVPCTDMILSNSAVELRGPGRGWLLDVSVYPENTTDALVFASSNEEVAEVSANGRITAIGPGSATITITCGNITKECVVNCYFDGVEPSEETESSETTEATTETTAATEPTESKDFQLDFDDVSLFSAGEGFTFGVTSGGQSVSRSQVEWKSSDSKVAKVENGTVTAVSGGTATITASYNGKTQKCVVRCRFETAATTEPQHTDNNWKLSDSDGDATIVVGESFSLRLTNASGETANVSWSSSNSGVVSISGNTVTGKLAGTTNVSATIDGKTYTCIVRVIEGR